MIVKIQDIRSDGLTVELNDGSIGFVPRKEISWSRVNPSPYSLFKEGQTIQAVLLPPTDYSDKKYLSIRQTSPDPWETLRHRYSVGQDVLGRVTAIFEGAAFVEFEEGIGGRVTTKNIGPAGAGYSSESISLGDIIRVRITGISDEYSNFFCSNTAAIEGRNDNGCSSENHNLSSKPTIPCITQTTESFVTGPISILLIDDDSAFCISTKRAFELAGHSLEYTTIPSKGIELATTKPYDIVIIDLVMPDMHGIEVYRHIKNKDPSVHMAIFTGEATIKHRELDDLTVKPLILHKPFDVFDVEAACFNETYSYLKIVPEISNRTVEKIAPFDSDDQRKDADEYVVEHISALSSGVQHTILGIFKWFESDQRLRLLKGKGFKFIGDATEMERIILFSRLRNIAEDREIIATPCMSESSITFRRSLKKVTPFIEHFESLFGAPIVVQGHSRYIIILGHVLPSVFGDAVQKSILERLKIIASELTVREAYKQIESQQRLALRGELTASLAHEIRNRLHIISMNMKAMKKLGPRAEHKLRQSNTFIPPELGQLNEILEESQSALDKISEVVTAFSEDIAERGYSTFDLTSLVRTVTTRLKLIANREHVAIQTDTQDECPASGSPARLGQVIENLILNAVQHTQNVRKRNRNVNVKWGKEENDDLFYVEVQDNGEGIHTKDYERIFDMGFTTKETGSGVGLALCLAAMRSLNGRVFVKQSILFEGTIMRIEWKVKETKDD